MQRKITGIQNPWPLLASLFACIATTALYAAEPPFVEGIPAKTAKVAGKPAHALSFSVSFPAKRSAAALDASMAPADADLKSWRY